MMRNTKALLKNKLAKDSEFAEIFANVSTMTEQEINSLKIQKWLKQELLREKRFSSANQGTKIMEINDIKILPAFKGMEVRESVTPEIDGEVRRWCGGDFFAAVDRSNFIQIQEEKLLFFPETGGVWIDTAFSNTVDHRLRSTVQVLNKTTRTNYNIMYKEDLLKRYPNAPSELVIDGGQTVSPERLSMAKIGVKFF